MSPAGCLSFIVGQGMKANITNHEISELRRMRVEPMFVEAGERLYPGAPTEEIRIRCSAVFQAMLDSLIERGSKVSEKDILKSFRTAMRAIAGEDSEEKDEACALCERVMEIYGIESSGGLLNRARYGIILGTILSRMQK
jgi:hypothetical protein